jgi:hypothetical protein
VGILDGTCEVCRKPAADLGVWMVEEELAVAVCAECKARIHEKILRPEGREIALAYLRAMGEEKAMPPIDNPKVVKWSNERARTMADALTALTYRAEAFAADYAAQGIDDCLAGNSSDDLVVDGSEQDGRPAVTRAAIVNSKAAVDAVVTLMDTVVGATGLTVFQIVNAIQVNGSPR